MSKKPATIVIVYLSPGANAVETANRVMSLVEDAKQTFPAGIDYKVGYDATKFVRAAISDVMITLLEADHKTSSSSERLFSDKHLDKK